MSKRDGLGQVNMEREGIERERERELFADPHRGNRLKQRYITFALRSDGSPERNLVQLCIEQDRSPPVRIIF